MPREVLAAANLASKLQSLRGCTEPVFVLLTATRKEDGTRWCPDCEEADPVISEAAQGAPAGVYFLEVEISREEWKTSPGPDHYLRKAPYNVGGIPTMLQWDTTANAALKKFNEADLLQLESLSSFFRRFAEKAT